MNATRKTSFIIITHSVITYLISYFIILIIYKLVTALTALSFDIPAILQQNQIIFIDNPEAWTYNSVKLIFSAGAVASLILGLVCLVIYLKAMTMNGFLKLFFLWGFILGLNNFTGSVVLGAFIYEGMGYVFEWLFLQDTAKMFLLLAGLIIMFGSGTLMVKPMIFSSNIYYNDCRPEIRPRFYNQQFVIPYFISTFIIILFRFPLSLYEFLLIISPGLFLIPLITGLHKFTIFFFDENERVIVLKKRLVLIALLSLIMLRVILGFGVRIG